MVRTRRIAILSAACVLVLTDVLLGFTVLPLVSYVGLAGLVLLWVATACWLVLDARRNQVLVRQAELLLQAMDSIDIGLSVTDPQGRILIMNQVVRRWIGLGPESAYDSALNAVVERTSVYTAPERQPVPPDQRPTALALTGEHVAPHDVFIGHGAGGAGATGDRRIEMSAYPVHNARGLQIGAVNVSRDVTSVRKTEERRQRASEQLAAVATARAQILADRDPRDTVARAALDVTGASIALLTEPRGSIYEVTASAGFESPPLFVERDSTSLISRVFEGGEPLVVRDMSSDPTVDRRAYEILRASVGGDLAAAFYVPVKVHGGCIGVLSVVQGANDPRVEFDEVLPIMELLAAETALALEREQLLARLGQQASTDELTGLANLRTWREALERMPRSSAIIVLDLDHFKQVNDRHGHAAGDQVLRCFAEVLLETLRAEDLAARVGGEEFAIIVHHPHVLRPLLSRLRHAWRNTDPATTFSAGTAVRRPGEHPVMTQRRADMALLKAKVDGRDRVVTAETIEASRETNFIRGSEVPGLPSARTPGSAD